MLLPCRFRLRLPSRFVGQAVAALTGFLLAPCCARSPLQHAEQFHWMHGVPVETLGRDIVAGSGLSIPGTLAEQLAYRIRHRGNARTFGALVQHDVDTFRTQ